MTHTIVSKKSTPPFLYRVKVYSNEYHPWSELRMTNEVYPRSLRNTAPSAMHICGKKTFVLYFIRDYVKVALRRWT